VAVPTPPHLQKPDEAAPGPGVKNSLSKTPQSTLQNVSPDARNSKTAVTAALSHKLGYNDSRSPPTQDAKSAHVSDGGSAEPTFNPISELWDEAYQDLCQKKQESMNKYEQKFLGVYTKDKSG